MMRPNANGFANFADADAGSRPGDRTPHSGLAYRTPREFARNCSPAPPPTQRWNGAGGFGRPRMKPNLAKL